MAVPERPGRAPPSAPSTEDGRGGADVATADGTGLESTEVVAAVVVGDALVVGAAGVVGLVLIGAAVVGALDVDSRTGGGMDGPVTLVDVIVPKVVVVAAVVVVLAMAVVDEVEVVDVVVVVSGVRTMPSHSGSAPISARVRSGVGGFDPSAVGGDSAITNMKGWRGTGTPGQS